MQTVTNNPSGKYNNYFLNHGSLIKFWGNEDLGISAL